MDGCYCQIGTFHPWCYHGKTSSAAGAAKQCVGGESVRASGMKCLDGSNWDGTSGLGQQMAALEVIKSNLIDLADHSMSESTGRTSVGDSAAGGKSFSE